MTSSKNHIEACWEEQVSANLSSNMASGLGQALLERERLHACVAANVFEGKEKSGLAFPSQLINVAHTSNT